MTSKSIDVSHRRKFSPPIDMQYAKAWALKVRIITQHTEPLLYDHIYDALKSYPWGESLWRMVIRICNLFTFKYIGLLGGFKRVFSSRVRNVLLIIDRRILFLGFRTWMRNRGDGWWDPEWTRVGMEIMTEAEVETEIYEGAEAEAEAEAAAEEEKDDDNYKKEAE